VKLLAEGRGRLAAHEWYVGEYYWKRSRWAGAAQRYQTLVERYPGSAQEAEALLKLAQACVKLDEKHRARTALQKLIVKHPQDPRRPEAEKLLASLR
jgi:outer membrane protein assembly factor BamD